ncbi:hypothetical protein ACFQ1M_12330 [Sungkyunkwania multivorans]|uniref:Uncharacterized protein n=1 Tax=Sungkyunkwania multivorans TaxID=1173618 RepID=A0ABW3CYV0_9FLAO
MKYLIRILFVLFLLGVAVGFYIKSQPESFADGQKIIGVSVLFFSFILMPLFIYHRWKDKNLKDYMLTQENLDKMRNKGPEKSDNQ